MDIRSHIRKNFKDADIDEIKSSIVESIKENDEITLPGLGVFFEILWDSSDENSREYILNTIKSHI